LTKHECSKCGKTYKSRSGLWKHEKKCDVEHTILITETKSPGEESVSPNPPDSTPPSADAHAESPGDTTTFEWADFDFGSSDHTDTIPTTLKSIVKPMPMGSGKLSKAQYEALENQNKGILKMGLSTIDVLLTKYGKAVSLDDTFEVRHSEADKELVANAQWRYLEEKGLFLTNYLSTGMIAGSLTVWYIGQPVMRIRKNAKKKLIRGRLLSRLPPFRWFRKKQPEIPDIAQNVEDNE